MFQQVRVGWQGRGWPVVSARPVRLTIAKGDAVPTRSIAERRTGDPFYLG